MTRNAIILIFLAILGAAVTWMIFHPDKVTVTWMAYQLIVPSWVILIALILLVFGIILRIFKLALWVAYLPKRISEGWKKRQKSQGVNELLDLASAVAAENVPDALKHQKKAQKTMSDEPLFWWYSAQAMGMADKHMDESQAYGKLAEGAPFLALKGQIQAALKRGDTQSALELLEKAQEAEPDSPWVLRNLVTLYRESKKYKQAEEVITRLEDLMYFSKAQAAKQLAVLYEMMADDSKVSEQDQDEALRKAHYLDPSLAHVTHRFAQLLMAQGHHTYALSALEATWKEAPSEEIGDLYIELQKPGSSVQAYELAKKLVKDDGRSPKSQLFVAKYALKAKLWGEARKMLVKLEEKTPSRETYKLLAELEMHEHDNIKAAHSWAAKGCVA